MRESLTADDGKLYAEPFYGESSFLMYRKDVFDAKGLTMPAHPTWQQVADLAAKADGAEPGMKGICLRGLPGWGEVMAPLTTVVNTIGGTWFDKDWKAQLDSPEFKKATKFYVDLVREHGESGAAQSGFAECLNNMTQGKTAMWYDATSAAGSAGGRRTPRSRARSATCPRRSRRPRAPAGSTPGPGASRRPPSNADKAWKFISWASSKEYEKLVGKTRSAGPTCPAGKRASTYDNPDYLEAAAAFAGHHREGHRRRQPANPGVQPRPAPGIQFVGIPEFTDLGTKVSQEISAAIAGRQSVDEALKQVPEARREGRRGVPRDR